MASSFGMSDPYDPVGSELVDEDLRFFGDVCNVPRANPTPAIDAAAEEHKQTLAHLRRDLEDIDGAQAIVCEEDDVLYTMRELLKARNEAKG